MEMTIERLWPQAKTSIACPKDNTILLTKEDHHGKTTIICPKCLYKHEEHV